MSEQSVMWMAAARIKVDVMENPSPVDAPLLIAAEWLEGHARLLHSGRTSGDPIGERFAVRFAAAYLGESPNAPEIDE